MHPIESYFHDGPIAFEHNVFEDERGLFFEAYKHFDFERVLSVSFKQDNISRSHKNVVRGIHNQIDKPLGKLVQVINGKVFDVFVDLRINSPSYGRYQGLYMSPGISLWLPPGFGHGFQSLENDSIIYYKYTEYYNPDGEQHVNPLDPDIAIEWPCENMIISKRDRNLPSLNELRGKK